MDAVDRVGYWLHKVTGFALEICAILILWHAFQAPPLDYQASAVTAGIAVLLSVLGLWLVLLGERLGRSDRP